MKRDSWLQAMGVAKESDMTQQLNKDLIGTNLFENDQVMGRLFYFFFPLSYVKKLGTLVKRDQNLRISARESVKLGHVSKRG